MRAAQVRLAFGTPLEAVREEGPLWARTRAGARVRVRWWLDEGRPAVDVTDIEGRILWGETSDRVASLLEALDAQGLQELDHEAGRRELARARRAAREA